MLEHLSNPFMPAYNRKNDLNRIRFPPLRLNGLEYLNDLANRTEVVSNEQNDDLH